MSLYLVWIQKRQAATLGEHGLRTLGRVMRGVTEDNNFLFLLQVEAIKDNIYSRHNVTGLSNIYEDVTVCLNSIYKTLIVAEDKNVKTKSVITSDIDLVIDNIAKSRVSISHGSPDVLPRGNQPALKAY